jgi:hypothetical protein
MWSRVGNPVSVSPEGVCARGVRVPLFVFSRLLATRGEQLPTGNCTAHASAGIAIILVIVELSSFRRRASYLIVAAARLARPSALAPGFNSIDEAGDCWLAVQVPSFGQNQPVSDSGVGARKRICGGPGEPYGWEVSTGSTAVFTVAGSSRSLM